MPKLGAYNYPDYTVTEAIQITKIIYSDSITSEVGLAAKLGHKNEKSGGFMMKMATLRRFGLITGTSAGSFNLTELGTNIAKPKDDKEYSESIAKMLMSVTLYGDIKKKLGTKLPGDDFWVVIHEITGVEKKSAEEEAPRIKRLYIDAEKYLRTASTNERGNIEQHIEMHGKPTLEDKREKNVELIEFRDAEAYMRFPKKKEVITRLKMVLEIYEKTISEDST